MASSPKILIAMPLFEGWEHVGQTLESIKRQTYGNYRVLISVDGNDQRSYDACEPFMEDPRFERVLQPHHLDWDGNMTWLGHQLREDFFCYWQHDDYCDPTYLETLVDHAKRHPQAASIYCDMKIYGDINRDVQIPSQTGFTLERVMRQVMAYDPAVIRCLIRADAMRASLPITVVSTWCMAVARVGELHRVPKLLYYRRIRPGSLTHTLPERPAEVLWKDALDWGLGVLENIQPLIQKEEELQLFATVADMIINRRIRGKWQYDFTTLERSEQVLFISELLLEAKRRFGVVPLPDLLASDDPRIVLQARKESQALFAGEDLLIDALTAALPSFVNAPDTDCRWFRWLRRRQDIDV